MRERPKQRNSRRLSPDRQLLLCLVLLANAAACVSSDCPGDLPPEGDIASFQAGPAEESQYSVSAPMQCVADDSVYEVSITGRGSVTVTDDWFETEIGPRIQNLALFWGINYGCSRRYPHAITARRWDEADRIARTVIDALVQDDRAGEIGIILENRVDCAASSD